MEIVWNLITANVYVVIVMIALVCLTLYYFGFWNSRKLETKFTACNSPECVRCGKYQQIRSNALQKLTHFASKNHISSGLERLYQAVVQKEPIHSPNTNQMPNVLYVSGLEARPVWNMSVFSSELECLENNVAVINQEFMNVYQRFNGDNQGWMINTTNTGQWSVYHLINQGEKIDANCKKCPATFRILEQFESTMIGTVFGNASFSVLNAGTYIEPHYGPCNTRIRCHLGLDIPNDCLLKVNGQDLSWRKGTCLLFDDSFLHSAENKNSCKSRIVLLVDFWHPGLSLAEKKAISYVF